MKTRARLAAAAAVLALAPALLPLGRPWLEGRLRARLEREARRHGLEAGFGAVRLGLWPPLVLEDVRLEKSAAFSLALARVELSWRPLVSPLRGRFRLAVGGVALNGPGGVALEAVPTVWDVEAISPAGWRAELRGPITGLSATWLPAGDKGRLEGSVEGLPAGRLLAVRHGDAPLLDTGTLRGRGLLVQTAQGAGFALRIEGLGVRLAALGAKGVPSSAAGLGLPTDVGVAFQGSWREECGPLEVPRWTAAFGGATFQGTLSLADLCEDPRLQLSLDVRHVEFAGLLRSSGLAERVAVAVGGAEAGPGDLGWASLRASADGRLSDPESFTVTQHLSFTPPRQLPPELLRLRGDFVHEVTLQNGDRSGILVSSESPDFIALGDVPPLFLRALLLAEDAGFYGHHGIDLAELPRALLTNWARGGPFRGASTLTQQLAKNLFLSREKRLGRKLQELSLALLLEATLDKQRLLEIYLSVIEWGPDIYGLRPAAHHYFQLEPGALTPAQMAFLVSLIPGPIKYQRALAEGVPAVWFRALVDDLLAKLRSLDALSEEQYRAALDERLQVSAPTPTAEPSSPQ